jgi:hypothetical protein
MPVQQDGVGFIAETTRVILGRGDSSALEGVTSSASAIMQNCTEIAAVLITIT